MSERLSSALTLGEDIVSARTYDSKAEDLEELASVRQASEILTQLGAIPDQSGKTHRKIRMILSTDKDNRTAGTPGANEPKLAPPNAEISLKRLHQYDYAKILSQLACIALREPTTPIDTSLLSNIPSYHRTGYTDEELKPILDHIKALLAHAERMTTLLFEAQKKRGKITTANPQSITYPEPIGLENFPDVQGFDYAVNKSAANARHPHNLRVTWLGVLRTTVLDMFQQKIIDNLASCSASPKTMTKEDERKENKRRIKTLADSFTLLFDTTSRKKGGNKLKLKLSWKGISTGRPLYPEEGPHLFTVNNLEWKEADHS